MDFMYLCQHIKLYVNRSTVMESSGGSSMATNQTYKHVVNELMQHLLKNHMLCCAAEMKI